MGTSYVEFIGRGYWTHDVFLEGLSYLLAREFKKIKVKEKWQTELIENWTVSATTGFVGCVPSYFNAFDTHDKVQLLRGNINQHSRGICKQFRFSYYCGVRKKWR